MQTTALMRKLRRVSLGILVGFSFPFFFLQFSLGSTHSSLLLIVVLWGTLYIPFFSISILFPSLKFLQDFWWFLLSISKFCLYEVFICLLPLINQFFYLFLCLSVPRPVYRTALHVRLLRKCLPGFICDFFSFLSAVLNLFLRFFVLNSGIDENSVHRLVERSFFPYLLISCLLTDIDCSSSVIYGCVCLNIVSCGLLEAFCNFQGFVYRISERFSLPRWLVWTLFSLYPVFFLFFVS